MIDIIKVLFSVVTALRGLAGLVADVLLVPFAVISDVVAQLIVDIKRVGNAFNVSGSFFSDESVAESKAKARETTEFIKELFADIGEEGKDIGRAFGLSFDEPERKLSELQKGAQAFADSLRKAADAEIPLRDDPDQPPPDRADPEAIARARDASQELVKLLRERRLGELELINPRLRQIELLNEQIAKVDALRAAGGDQVLAEREINDLIEERNQLIAQTDVGQGLAAGITGAFQGAFESATKDGANFTQVLAANLEDSANQALVDGFESSFEELQKALGETFDAVAKSLEGVFGDAFKGLGGALGDVLSGTLQFVAQQALAALLGGGGNTSGSSAGNVQSAVTSTQAVRGIVAGPQEIAIANVGANIADAVEPLLEETRTQTGVLRAILANSISGTTGSGTDSDLAALANGGAPLAAA